MPRSTQAISLMLTPMQISEALLTSAGAQSGSWMGTDAIASNLNLVIRPGEPSEMVVQIRNLGDRSLELILQVEGNFPQEWCRIGTEGAEVRAGQQTEAVLYFQIPSDFFEQSQALTLPRNPKAELSRALLGSHHRT